MNIIAKIKSYHLLVRNLLHNLQYKRKTSHLLILNRISSRQINYLNIKHFARGLSSIKHQTTNGNSNNKIMESTASNVKVGSGDNSNSASGNTVPTFHRTSFGQQPGISSCQSNQQRSKESNNQVYTMHVDNDNDTDLSKLYYVVERNTVYRHTRFTYSSASNENKKLFSSRSLPDHASLQNVYFLRNEHELKNIKRPISTGDIRKEQESNDRQAVAGLRKWMLTKNGEQLERQNCTNRNGLEFKILNYNVLAQDLLTEHAYLYRKHTPVALLWETRWKNLYKEITEHDPDILCLQEVQESHLDEYYKKITDLGYGFIYKKRTGYRTDGCALFYRKDLFNLEDFITVEYYQPYTTLLDRENVAIVAVLSPIERPAAKFVVATTHLLYNPRRQDIRVAQTQVLLAEVERMAYKENDRNGEPVYYPIIITGDFNSEPDSAVVKLLVRGELHYENLAKKSLAENVTTFRNGKELIPPVLRITDHCQHVDLLAHRSAGVELSRREQDSIIYLQNTNQTAEKKMKYDRNDTLFATGSVSHKFNLKSVYEYFVDNDTEGTTYQDAWITVDYIFYSEENSRNNGSKLKLLARYSMPTKKQLKIVRTIPNLILGSDHLSLLAKFKIEF